MPAEVEIPAPVRTATLRARVSYSTFALVRRSKDGGTQDKRSRRRAEQGRSRRDAFEGEVKRRAVNVGRAVFIIA